MKKTILIIGLCILSICCINMIIEVVEASDRKPYTYEDYLKNKSLNGNNDDTDVIGLVVDEGESDVVEVPE